jgi:dCTP diphosphatase
MRDLRELQQRIIAFRDARDWQQFHNPKDVAISLVLEASELLEHFQWKNNEEMKKHISKHKEEVGDELADVLYWVLLIANDFDINISDALDKKLQKNEAKYPVEKAKGSHKKYTEYSE